MSAISGCGTDAERRYSDLSTREVSVPEGGYRLRYLAPPWKRLKDDPLVTGSRKAVPVGDATRAIVPDSGAVLEVAKESTVQDTQNLTQPKYRLEAALVRCEDSELEADQSCAAALAAEDYGTKREQGDFRRYGTEPRAGHNDFDQRFYEMLGLVADSRRYQRVVYYETAEETLAARLFIEGNPDLGEQEITRLVRAFEIINPQEEP